MLANPGRGMSPCEEAATRTSRSSSPTELRDTADLTASAAIPALEIVVRPDRSIA